MIRESLEQGNEVGTRAMILAPDLTCQGIGGHPKKKMNPTLGTVLRDPA